MTTVYEPTGRGVLERYYSGDVLHTDSARRVFLMPERSLDESSGTRDLPFLQTRQVRLDRLSGLQ